MIKKILHQRDKYLSFLFVVCILYLYIIPFNFFSYNLIVLPLVCWVGALYILQKNEKYNIKMMLLLFCFFLASIINFDHVSFIMCLSVTLFYFTFREEKEVSNKLLMFLYWLAIIGIVCQLVLYRSSDGRMVLSVIDPNFSGLLMLLFFYYCDKNNFKVGKILSLVSVFILMSRNYLLAIIIFYIVKKFKNRFYCLLSRFENFGLLLVTGTILIIILSNYWVSNVNFTISYESDVDRLLHINDKSNMHRFYINEYVYYLITTNNEVFLWGLKDSFEGHMRTHVNGIPHNSMLFFLAKYGAIYSFFYFMLLSSIISKFFKFQNYEYIYSYIVFSFFLHATFNSIIILFFISILSLRPRKYLKKDK